MARTEDERIKQNEHACKLDTRRKIVAGAIILKHAEIDEVFAGELYGLLDKFVSVHDRHLFDLPEGDKKLDIDVASSL